VQLELVYNKKVFSLFAALFLTAIAFAFYTDEYIIAAVPFVLLFFYWSWYQRETVFLLLLLSLSFSTEFNFTPSLGTDLPDEPLMLLVSFLSILYWYYHPKVMGKKQLIHPILLLLIIIFCWSLVATAFSVNFIVSLKYVLAKTWYIGAFVIAPLLFFVNEKNIKTAAAVIAFSLVAVALITLFRHYQYVFRFAYINEALYPFFRNHVNYSAMLVCSIPLLIAFYSGAKKQIQKYLLISCVLIVLAALFFSFSRGAWLALIAGLTVYWLIKKKILVYSYVFIIVVLMMVFSWLRYNDNYLNYSNDFKTTIFHKNFSEHLIATYKLKDVSTAERFYRWVAGVRMIKDEPLVGYGPGTFYEHYKEYAIPTFKTWVSDNPERSTVHNYFLYTIIEQGIPALIFLLLLFGSLLYYAQKIVHQSKNNFTRIAATSIAVIVVMIIVVNFLSDLIETDKIGSLFFLCIATLVVLDIKTRNEKSNLSPHI